MTDKQIIIDGVDVSGCKWFCKWNSKCSLFDCPYGGHPQCDNGELYDCDHKQLKRKEQECEELTEKVKKYGEINEQETKDYAELKNKAEKCKQTLADIKEIAENVQSFVGRIDIEDDVFEQMEQILQKISEAKDEKI